MLLQAAAFLRCNQGYVGIVSRLFQTRQEGAGLQTYRT